MSGFDTFVMVDWSAGKRGPARPTKDALWLAVARRAATGDAAAVTVEEPLYFRGRAEVEAWLAEFLGAEVAAGRRVLAGFDFPFGYPAGFATHVTGSDTPLAMWDWLAARVEDAPDGSNNRFELAEQMNRMSPGPGPFWGKSSKTGWPDLPYRKEGIDFAPWGERRVCDTASGASSSCFQMYYPPTVGGQAIMGMAALARLRQRVAAAVWPFEDIAEASVVLAEIWPGVIEPAVKEACAGPETKIRDREQVRLLAGALARLPGPGVAGMLAEPLPKEAAVEGWILGAAAGEVLTEAARGAVVPPLRNDCFALPPGVHWTPVDAALEMLRDRLHPVAGVETVPLAQAEGRIAAADCTALRANPPLPNTAVDGYGFAGARGPGLHEMPLAGARAAAGDSPGVLPGGQAMRVLTGAALPEGVDTVILQEDVVVSDGVLRFSGPVKAGANTRRAGEDAQAGDVVLAEGQRIGPPELALLAAVGRAEVAVRRPLRVGVLSTGDELVPAGGVAAPGQIYDANRPMLLALLRQFGHAAVDLGQVGDDRDALRARLDGGGVDAILTSGGASAGDEDHVSALLEEAGALTLWRIAVKPGRPLALGLWDGVPVFGLPGNPVAAMVCALIFARPALGLLAGAGWSAPQGFEVPAAFSKRKKAGRREYLRARMREGRAEVFASEGSGRISGLSWAEGLVELPEAAAEIGPGDPVRFIPYGSFGR